MPIVPSIKTTRISQAEFGELSYEVMQHVFAIYNDFGRLFDELVYKRELAARMDNVLLEVPVDVVHKTFGKRYYADVVVARKGLFEFKAADAIHPKHRTQGIHYLMLLALSHGKVINTRTEQVQHEFINCHQTLEDRRKFTINTMSWSSQSPGATVFRDVLTALLKDWGVGHELSLYQEAVTHFLGGETSVESSVSVTGSNGYLVDQQVRLAAPNIAFKITAFTNQKEEFATQAQKQIKHTSLEAIQWANIENNHVTFRTIR